MLHTLPRPVRLPDAERAGFTTAPSYLIVMLNYSGSQSCCATMNWAVEFVSHCVCVCVRVWTREERQQVMWQWCLSLPRTREASGKAEP